MTGEPCWIVRTMGRARRGIAVAGCLVWTTTATAQTAGVLTPDEFTPLPPRLSGSIDFTGAPGLDAPPGADQLSITIGRVVIEDALPALDDVNRAVVARLTRGPILASEIFEAASALEAAYAQAGFVLARVVLPAQSLVDGGTLRLVVVDGFIERVDTEQVPERVRDRLEKVTEPLVGQRSITLSEIERQLLIAGDTYGVRLGSTLAAGDEPGGTVVVLTPDFRAVTGFLGFDNGLSDDLGGFSIDAGVEMNGALGLGEVLYGRGSFFPSLGDGTSSGGVFGAEPRFRTLAGGAVFPIGRDGFLINLEGTLSRTTPMSDGAPTTSRFERASLRLSYPIVRSRALNVSAQGILDIQTDSQDILSGAGDITLFRDDFRVLRGGVDLRWQRASGTVIEAAATFSQGIDVFGARTAADAGGLPLSRTGADAVFSKLEVSARLRQPLGERFQLSLAGRAQTSFGDPLLQSEQFGIATSSELSPFDSGTLVGDSGWVVRGEVSAPIATQFGQLEALVIPYLFSSVGKLSVEAPTALESAIVNAAAFGVGVDIARQGETQFQSSSLRVEYGRGFRDDTGADTDRISISASLRF